MVVLVHGIPSPAGFNFLIQIEKESKTDVTFSLSPCYFKYVQCAMLMYNVVYASLIVSQPLSLFL